MANQQTNFQRFLSDKRNALPRCDRQVRIDDEAHALLLELNATRGVRIQFAASEAIKAYCRLKLDSSNN